MAARDVLPSSSSSSSFAPLSPNIAAAVLRRLPSHIDRVRFAAVCRPWRAAANHHPKQPLPWLALPDGTFFSYPPAASSSSAALLFPAAAAGYLGSCGDCLIFFSGDGDGGCEDGYLLVNPFSGGATAVMRLPGLTSVRFVLRDGTPLPWRGIADDRRAPMDAAVRKVVMCSSRVVVAAMVGDGRIKNKVAVCRPGSGSSSSWTMRAHDAWRRFTDIAFFDGKLFAVEDSGDLFAMPIDVDSSIGEPKVSWAKIVIHASGSGNAPATARRRRKAPPAMRYLLVSGGRLLMVHREIVGGDGTTCCRFAVFKADLVSSRWSAVESVGDDTALFVGRWNSFSRHVSTYGLPGNRIHFLDDDDVFCNGGGGTKFGSYDMTDGTTYPLLLQPPLEDLRRNNGDRDTPATWLFPLEQGKVVNWCDLPSDMYGHILRRLHANKELIRLSAVCRHWHAIAQQHFVVCRRRQKNKIFPFSCAVVVDKAPPTPAAVTTAAAQPTPAMAAVAPPPPPPAVPVAYLALQNGEVLTYPEHTPPPPLLDIVGDIAGGHLCAACDDWLLFNDDAWGCAKLRYLVVPAAASPSSSSPELRMVVRRHRRWPSVEVFSADMASSRWVAVHRLSPGEALFVGRFCSRAVVRRGGGGGGVRGDQVFFIPDDCVGMSSFWEQRWSTTAATGHHHAAAVYDMLDGSVTHILPRQQQRQSRHVPTPAAAAAWLFPSSSSDNDGIITQYWAGVFNEDDDKRKLVVDGVNAMLEIATKLISKPPEN